jgi:hypothetical protein
MHKSDLEWSEIADFFGLSLEEIGQDPAAAEQTIQQQLAQLQSLPELSADDLKEILEDSNFEQLTQSMRSLAQHWESQPELQTEEFVETLKQLFTNTPEPDPGNHYQRIAEVSIEEAMRDFSIPSIKFEDLLE